MACGKNMQCQPVIGPALRNKSFSEVKKVLPVSGLAQRTAAQIKQKNDVTGAGKPLAADTAGRDSADLYLFRADIRKLAGLRIVGNSGYRPASSFLRRISKNELSKNSTCEAEPDNSRGQRMFSGGMHTLTYRILFWQRQETAARRNSAKRGWLLEVLGKSAPARRRRSRGTGNALKKKSSRNWIRELFQAGKKFDLKLNRVCF